MPRASRAPINTQLAKEATENVVYLLQSFSSAEAGVFYEEFFTEEERTMLAKRLMVYLMLSKGYKVGEISAVLGMSRETIRVYNMQWEDKGEAYKKLITRIEHQENSKQLWRKIERVLKPVGTAIQSQSNRHVRAKLTSGNVD